MTTLSAAECKDMLDRLHANLEVVIKGKSGPLQTLVAAFAAGGSVLMEDVPGVGKTTLAKALAKSIRAQYNRVQFTPDLLPADILGSSVYNPSSGDFTFHKGPVFSNVLLADEINRASPRTQSALLEAMSEHQATIEGKCYVLPRPFFVIATHNPLEFHGTYPLPEAQLDRFMIRLNLGYPDTQAAREILFSQALEHPLETLEAVLTGDDIQALQQAVRAVHFEESIAGYLIDLVEHTRQDQRLKLGVSPRGALLLFIAAKASAAQDGRDFVLPDDVQRMAPCVLTHRVLLTSKAKYSGVQQADIIADSLSAVAVPT